MEEQSKSRRGQRLASHGPRREELLATRVAHLLEGGVDRLTSRSRHRRHILGRLPRFRLTPECGVLPVIELCASGVSRQAVEAPGGVSKMVAETGGAVGTQPQLLERNAARGELEILPRLHEGVRGGLEERVDPFDWTPEPRLGHV